MELCQKCVTKVCRNLSEFCQTCFIWQISDTFQTYHMKHFMKKFPYKSVGNLVEVRIWHNSDHLLMKHFHNKYFIIVSVPSFWHIFDAFLSKWRKHYIATSLQKSINILSVSAFWQIFDTFLINQRNTNVSEIWHISDSAFRATVSHKCVRNMFWQNSDTFLI